MRKYILGFMIGLLLSNNTLEISAIAGSNIFNDVEVKILSSVDIINIYKKYNLGNSMGIDQTINEVVRIERDADSNIVGVYIGDGKAQGIYKDTFNNRGISTLKIETVYLGLEDNNWDSLTKVRLNTIGKNTDIFRDVLGDISDIVLSGEVGDSIYFKNGKVRIILNDIAGEKRALSIEIYSNNFKGLNTKEITYKLMELEPLIADNTLNEDLATWVQGESSEEEISRSWVHKLDTEGEEGEDYEVYFVRKEYKLGEQGEYSLIFHDDRYDRFSLKRDYFICLGTYEDIDKLEEKWRGLFGEREGNLAERNGFNSLYVAYFNE